MIRADGNPQRREGDAPMQPIKNVSAKRLKSFCGLSENLV